MGQRARSAARRMARATTEEKNRALLALAEKLKNEGEPLRPYTGPPVPQGRRGEQILAANAQDLDHAKASGLAPDASGRCSTA